MAIKERSIIQIYTTKIIIHGRLNCDLYGHKIEHYINNYLPCNALIDANIFFHHQIVTFVFMKIILKEKSILMCQKLLPFL